MDGAEDLSEAVRDAVARQEHLQEALQELIETEQQYIAMGERYYRERQYRVSVAAVAARVIARTHAESHAGSIETCAATRAADWAVVHEASGVTAPAS
jgi:hypothetical protein